MTRAPLLDRLAQLEEFLLREKRERAAADVRQAINRIATCQRERERAAKKEKPAP